MLESTAVPGRLLLSPEARWKIAAATGNQAALRKELPSLADTSDSLGGSASDFKCHLGEECSVSLRYVDLATLVLVEDWAASIRFSCKEAILDIM